MDDLVGQQFGNYLLTQHLGHGGFADVYLGEHRLLKTRAAIKIMHNQLNEQEFLEEARTIAALAHPNIVRVLEFDVKERNKHHHVPFLVMDYAPQGTLRNRHPRGTILPLNTVFLYIQQVADALQFAHEHKVIHRDVKPENMLIDPQGKILLSDFGIAAIAHSTTSLKTTNNSGTPLYMAPEQWNGKPRPASDQYSLGIIAYEWLSGQCPFQGDLYALVNQHSNMAPAPFAQTLRIPTEVERAVQKALAKNPDQRFPDVKTFAQALTQTNQTAPHLAAANYPSPAPIASQRPIPPTMPVIATPQQPVTQPQPMTPQAPMLSDTLYREGIKAQAQGDLERTATLWQQVLTTDPDYGNGRLAIQMKELLVELHPIRVQRARQEAENAHSQGAWQQEIAAWKHLLTLQPTDQQAKERIPVATNNEQCAWMYENAKHFSAEGDPAATRVQLTALWQKAPYYGDPAHIARNVKITVPPSYETQRVATQQAAANEQAKQREAAALAQAKRQAEDAKSAKTAARKAFISNSDFTSSFIYFLFFCTAGGIGASVGMFTQSWILASVATLLVAIITALSGYRKAMPWFALVIMGIVSLVSAFGIAILASLQPYNVPQSTTFWFVGSRNLWDGRQAIAGTIIGLVCGLLLGGIVTALDEDEEEGALALLSFGGILLILVPWLVPYFNGGFGFGPGWPILLLGIAVGLFGGGGAFGSFYIGTVASDS